MIRVKSGGSGLAVERVLVAPPTGACGAVPTVEVEGGTLHESMRDLLGSKNPCLIPEKDLHRELERCKNCLKFSGVDVTMQLSCGGKPRQPRMDILDRDLFDSAPNTPENTSWTMGMLGRIDKVLGSGVWDKPIFAMGDAAPKPGPNTELVQEIREGKYDELFGKGQLVSQIALDAAKAPPPPLSVKIDSVYPTAPISAKLPVYPPIARAARVEGVVEIAFEINSEGKVVNVVVVDGPRMLQNAVTDTLPDWSFPQSAWGSSSRAVIRFKLNCM